MEFSQPCSAHAPGKITAEECAARLKAFLWHSGLWTCTSKPQEVLHQKKAVSILQIGADKVVREGSVAHANHDVPLSPRYCHHMSGVLTFTAHRQLVDALLNKYLEDPLADYLPVTWMQLKVADEWLFIHLA
eukprot:3598689-Amphidinium_carterae.1